MSKRRVADQLPSGKWRARYYDEDGKRHSRSFDTFNEAKDWRTAQLASVTAKKHVGPSDGKITLEDYAESAYLVSRYANRLTESQVRQRLNKHVYPVLGSVRLRDLRPSAVQGWLNRMSGSPQTRRLIFANLKTILSAAVDDGCIAVNPCDAASIRRPKVTRTEPRIFSAEQVLAIRDALPHRYRALVTLAAGLGLRQGEVFGLAVTDVDFLRGEVHVRQQVRLYPSNRLVFSLPKYESTRTVPLPASVRDDLAVYLAEFPARLVSLPWNEPNGDEQAHRLIVTGREGRALNRNYLNGAVWHPALREAGIEPTRATGMHALRHWYASTLLDAGESIKVVADRLGHADPAFTLRTYTHTPPNTEERTRSAIDAAMKPSTGHTRVTDTGQ